MPNFLFTCKYISGLHLLVELTRGLYSFDQNMRPTNFVLKESTQGGVKSFSRWNYAGYKEISTLKQK